MRAPALAEERFQLPRSRRKRENGGGQSTDAVRACSFSWSERDPNLAARRCSAMEDPDTPSNARPKTPLGPPRRVGQIILILISLIDCNDKSWRRLVGRLEPTNHANSPSCAVSGSLREGHPRSLAAAPTRRSARPPGAFDSRAAWDRPFRPTSSGSGRFPPGTHSRQSER
jgi:hypothetical protein